MQDRQFVGFVPVKYAIEVGRGRRPRPTCDATPMRRIVQRSESIESQKADIAVCIVDPDTRTPLPVGQPGLLLVRGPNVMQGYLGKPEKTAEVLQNGWYVCRLRRFIGNVTAMQLVDPYLTNA